MMPGVLQRGRGILWQDKIRPLKMESFEIGVFLVL